MAISVFLALGFAFYVFSLPFVGTKLLQYIVLVLYTPLVTCVFCLYIWCAATDPCDSGILRTKRNAGIEDGGKQNCPKISGQHGAQGQSSQQISEDGMFYCSICEVEVQNKSKHCRVCDKCVDGFDHHCRWINNCVGRKNYLKFFVLMISAILLLILQWSVGILVMLRCFFERKRFSMEITSKLGSSFSFVPFVIVEVICSGLAMFATLPLCQLFFFHVLLIKKGISTYDFIIAVREQEQLGGVGHQSPLMSSASSLTGFSIASSFNAFHHGAWCTPPRLFLEDQFDVIPPEAGISTLAKRSVPDTSSKKKIVATNPWALARLDADEISKAAAQVRKKSRILHPVERRAIPLGQESDANFLSGSGSMVPRPANQRLPNKRSRAPMDLSLEPPAKISTSSTDNETNFALETSTFAPLQLEARSAFRSIPGVVTFSPDSSLDSPDLRYRDSSSGAEEGVLRSLTSAAEHKAVRFPRSNSDGYEASGGEDSDRVPSRIVHRSSDWSNLLISTSQDGLLNKLKASYSGGLQADV